MGQRSRSWVTAQGSRVTGPGQGSGSMARGLVIGHRSVVTSQRSLARVKGP